MPLAPNTQFSHYELLTLLGKGGMGEVYLAEDIRLHRRVALNVLPASLRQNKDRLRRYEQESFFGGAGVRRQI